MSTEENGTRLSGIQQQSQWLRLSRVGLPACLVLNLASLSQAQQSFGSPSNEAPNEEQICYRQVPAFKIKTTSGPETPLSAFSTKACAPDDDFHAGAGVCAIFCIPWNQGRGCRAALEKIPGFVADFDQRTLSTDMQVMAESLAEIRTGLDFWRQLLPQTSSSWHSQGWLLVSMGRIDFSNMIIRLWSWPSIAGVLSVCSQVRPSPLRLCGRWYRKCAVQVRGVLRDSGKGRISLFRIRPPKRALQPRLGCLAHAPAGRWRDFGDNLGLLSFAATAPFPCNHSLPLAIPASLA